MPFNEVIPVYNEIIRNAYVQNAALLTVNADGTYSYHSILKGQSEYWLGAAAITMTTRFEESTVWDSGLEFGPRHTELWSCGAFFSGVCRGLTPPPPRPIQI
jgi:hypothetical protein